MNLLDKAISVFDPVAGLRRARARAAIGLVQQLAYEGAASNRRTSGWTRPSSSANAEVGIALRGLRDGARDLVRNHPLAEKAVNEFSVRVVGPGIQPRAATDSPAINEILDDKFAEWCPQASSDSSESFYALQALAVRSIVESGEVVNRTRPRLIEDRLAVPMQVQILESDWIDSFQTRALPNGGRIIQGVEMDPIGREVAVWLYPNHPGDALGLPLGGLSTQSVRTPIDSGNSVGRITRSYRRSRPGQVRGVSWFAPVMMPFYDLAGYEDAEGVRKRIEACLAVLISGPEVDPYGSPAVGKQSKDADGKLLEEIRPGMIGRVGSGSSVTVLEPKPAGGYADYVRVRHRVIAAGLGMPYEVLTGDLSQINYSSYRGGLIGFRDLIEFIQWNILIPTFCTPVWNSFVAAAAIAGIVPAGTSTRVEWDPPKFDLLDRAEEAKADLEMIRSGTLTWPQAVARQGYDPKKQLAEIKQWNAELDKAEVILDCDPRKVARSGMTQQEKKTQQGALTW